VKRLPTDAWVTLAVSAALVSTAVLLVYLPQGRKLKTLQTEAASRRTTIEANAKEAAVVPEMARQIEDMKKRYKGFDRKMPKQKELAGFLQEISRILASERLTTQNTEPGSPKQEKLYHTLPIIMKLQGPYLSVISLLDQIDRMQRLARVQKLLVTADPKKKTQDLNIELQMNIYFTES